MRYTGPKVRKARRLGMAFTAKDAKIMQKRGFAPGQHGQNKSRVSEYGSQLREKQKLKVNYGILEKQFRKYYTEALKKPGVTGDILLGMLESRLDNIVFRLGFAETRAQARQIVRHGFVEVNGKKTDIPSFFVKVGNVIALREQKKKTGYVSRLKEKIKNFKTQEWLSLEAEKLSGKMLSVPTPEMIGNIINTQAVVEHYSR